MVYKQTLANYRNALNSMRKSSEILLSISFLIPITYKYYNTNVYTVRNKYVLRGWKDGIFGFGDLMFIKMRHIVLNLILFEMAYIVVTFVSTINRIISKLMANVYKNETISSVYFESKNTDALKNDESRKRIFVAWCEIYRCVPHFHI